jgi:hypothetical protein
VVVDLTRITRAQRAGLVGLGALERTKTPPVVQERRGRRAGLGLGLDCQVDRESLGPLDVLLAALLVLQLQLGD